MPTTPPAIIVSSGRDSDVAARHAISFQLGRPARGVSASSKIIATSSALANATSMPDSAHHANGPMTSVAPVMPAAIAASGSFCAAANDIRVAMTKRRTRSGFFCNVSVAATIASPSVFTPRSG